MTHLGLNRWPLFEARHVHSLDIFDRHLIDTGQRRTLPTKFEHLINDVSGTGEHCLDAAVAHIADSAAQIQSRCFLFCPAAKPNALNATLDVNVDSAFRQSVSRKFHDHLINGQAGTGLGFDLGHHTVAFGAQHVFHLHRFDHTQLFAGFNFLAGLDGDRHQHTWHR